MRLDLALGSASHIRRSFLLEETLYEGHTRAVRGDCGARWPFLSRAPRPGPRRAVLDGATDAETRCVLGWSLADFAVASLTVRQTGAAFGSLDRGDDRVPRHSVTLRLPDGASAVVTLDEARTLERRLWAVGFAPGAAAAAGKLADSTSSWVHDPQRVDFNRREATPVVAAGSWITWTNRSFDV